jgi:hypothetical protein
MFEQRDPVRLLVQFLSQLLRRLLCLAPISGLAVVKAQVWLSFKLTQAWTSLCDYLAIFEHRANLIVNLFVDVFKNDITGKQFGYVLWIFASEIFVFDIEKLFV